MAVKSTWLPLFVILGSICLSLEMPTKDELYENMMEAMTKHKTGNRLLDGSELPKVSEYEDFSQLLGWNPEEEQALQHEEHEDLYNGKLELERGWPSAKPTLGQVAGVATDKSGSVHIFHRADRIWEEDSFNDDNTYTKRKEGPIKEATIAMLNKSNGAILEKWGDNFFYLPHGLEIDDQGNFWVTDVAMHQVFRFKKGESKPSLVLGKAFQPAKNNHDTERFCQPTDVAVASNGDFFVADGYCASRILKYNKDGKLLGKFAGGELWIPHSLALAEDMDRICVADRENMRILCYNAGLKNPENLGEFDDYLNFEDEMLGRVFAIAYSPKDGVLFAVNGPTADYMKVEGLTIDLRDDPRHRAYILSEWSPGNSGFVEPHDLAVTPDGNTVYVGEISPTNIWKFKKPEDE